MAGHWKSFNTSRGCRETNISNINIFVKSHKNKQIEPYSPTWG